MQTSVQTPQEFDLFQLHVQENNTQLARFDFLQVRSYFEGCQIGPSNPGVPEQGATSLEMIFKYYAARRQSDQIEGGKSMTFSDIHEANITMDMSELTKFMKEFLPGVFSRKDTNWMFKMANSMEHGLSDESVFTMDYEEFVALLCQVAMQLFRGCTPQEMARKLGQKLRLDDPLAMRSKLKKMGRIDAGFGAWKSDEGTIGTKKFDPEARCPLDDSSNKHVLNHNSFLCIKKLLMHSFPDVKIPEWMPFPGPFIAFVFPENGVREGKKMRFKLSIRNIAPRYICMYVFVFSLIYTHLHAIGRGTRHAAAEEIPPPPCTIRVRHMETSKSYQRVHVENQWTHTRAVAKPVSSPTHAAMDMVCS